MLRLLLFFPSVTFGLINAEIFPWATFYTLLKIRKISKIILFFIALLVFSALITTLIYQGAFIAESVRSISAYLNPFLLFIFLMHASRLEISRLVQLMRLVLVGVISLGCFQAFGWVSFLEPLITTLVPRGSAMEFGGGRGVLLMTTEPSRAAIEVLLLYAAWRALSTAGSTKLLFFDIIIAIFIIGFIKSAVGVAMLLIYLFTIYRAGILLVLTILVPVMVLYIEENRALILLTDLIRTSSFQEVFNLFVGASGFRIVSVVGAYWAAIFVPFGGGVGAWQESSVRAMVGAGFAGDTIDYFVNFSDSTISGVRPTAYMASIGLDLGIFGVALLVFLLKRYFVRAWRCDKSVRPLLWLVIIGVFVNGDVGNPVQWMALALVIRVKEASESHDKIRLVAR